MTDVAPAAPAEPTFAETATALMEDLVEMDRLAQAQGSSLVDIIAKAANTQSGINVRPADPLPPEPTL